MASWIKPVLISTGLVAVAMHLKVIVPAMALDVSRAPILLSSFLSWLKPPYLYVITNVIIIIIGVSSKYYRSIIINNDDKDYETSSYGGDYKTHQNEQNLYRASTRRQEAKDADLNENFRFAGENPAKIIVEEKERHEMVKEMVAEAVVKVEEEEKSCLVVVVAKPGNMIPIEKPLVTARIGNRKLVKTTTAERNSLKALKVAKPKKNETLENTWKLITEGKPVPLTSHYRRPDTFGLEETKQSGLKKSDTVKDRTKYYLSPAVSRSRDELNRRADSFIKKCNDERFESMRLDRELNRRSLSF